MILRLLWSILWLGLLYNSAYAQVRPPLHKQKMERNTAHSIREQTTQKPNTDIDKVSSDTSEVIEMRHANEIEGMVQNGESIRFLKGNVIFHQKEAYFYCDSAYLYDDKNEVLAWGNVTIVQSDTIEMFSDSLRYYGATKDAYMINNVVLKDTTQQIFTEHLHYNTHSKIATYTQGGMLRKDDAQLTSGYGQYDTSTDLAFFRDSVLVINDKFTLKADSLQYDTENRRSRFIGPTLIIQDSTKIYCEKGFYDYNKNTAAFQQNPQYVSGAKTAIAKRMDYDGDLKKVTLSGNARFKENEKNAGAEIMEYDEKQKVITLKEKAWFKEKDRYAEADKITHDETSELTQLTGNAYFKDKDKDVKSDVIIYDGKNDSYETEGKTIAHTGNGLIEANDTRYDKKTDTNFLEGEVYISDSTQILQAESVQINNTTEDAFATGEVHWQDTVNQVSIQSENLWYNKKTKYTKATGRPLMTSVLDNDTLFLVADTLISQEIIRDSLQDTSQLLLAYGDVRIFKSDFQAVCDSLEFNGRDSIFDFHKRPILWSDSTQFSAKTIRMTIQHETLDSIYLKQRAFITETPDEQFFNQIKGRNIEIAFQNKQLHQMNVLGNGQTVYYARDDKDAYIGPNKIECSTMNMYFKDGALNFIRYLVEPKGKITPMKQANHSEFVLEGFEWHKEIRPLSLADLFKIHTNKEKEESPEKQENKNKKKQGRKL